jgi:hypothetical protein
MTEEQIDQERALYVEQGGYNMMQRAREIGVNRSTLEYHLRPVRMNKARFGAKTKALIDAGDALALLARSHPDGMQFIKRWHEARAHLTQVRPKPTK